MNIIRPALVALVLVPRAAEACASCMSSPFGDQTYNAAYYALMATPFVVVLGVGAVLTGCYLSARRRRPPRAEASFSEETTWITPRR